MESPSQLEMGTLSSEQTTTPPNNRRPIRGSPQVQQQQHSTPVRNLQEDFFLGACQTPPLGIPYSPVQPAPAGEYSLFVGSPAVGGQFRPDQHHQHSILESSPGSHGPDPAYPSGTGTHHSPVLDSSASPVTEAPTVTSSGGTGGGGASAPPLNVPTLQDLMTRLNMGNPLGGGTGFPYGAVGAYPPPLFPTTVPLPTSGVPPLNFEPQTVSLLTQMMAAGFNPYSYYNQLNQMMQASATTTDPYLLEQAARAYRVAQHSVCEPSCTWSGPLPPRNYKNPTFSCKIFVGGVPWDITEAALLTAFKPFGPVRVEWPGKEARYARSPVKPSARGKTGYVYMIFDHEKSVKGLLSKCSQEFGQNGDWYFKLTARRQRTKEIRQVQIIPWITSDSNHTRIPNQRLDPQKTIFVGALHGMITAEVLATIMNDLFGNVVYAGIDTDKFKYPIGSGRVAFSSERSYYKAINAAFVEIKTNKFTKKVQIDPFLEDAICSLCHVNAGPYFCREMICFRYFCRGCWQTRHNPLEMRTHKPLMRNTRRAGEPGSSSSSGGPPAEHSPPQQLRTSSDAPDPFGSSPSSSF